MNPQAADSRLPLSGCSPEGTVHLVRWTLLCAAGTAVAVALFLLTRRWAGAESQPLDSRVLVVAAGGTAAGLWLLHGAWRWGGAELPGKRWRLEPWCQGLVTVAAVAAGLTLLPAGSPTLAAVACWTVLLGGEACWWGVEFRRVRRPRSGTGSTWLGAVTRAAAWRRNRPTTEVTDASSAPSLATAPVEDESLEETPDDLLPPSVRQRMTRAVDETGAEVIYGAVRCDFAAGQRQENIHLAFCPPLSATPELSAEQVDGPVAKIQTALVQPFGAAIEVRLPSPSTEPASVLIQFYACVPHGT